MDSQAVLSGKLGSFLASLKQAGNAYRFDPCRRGHGTGEQQPCLGFSCFALKIFYTLGLWDKLPDTERQQWLDYLKSFQLKNDTGATEDEGNAFIDPVLYRALEQPVSGIRGRIRALLGHREIARPFKVVVAETKQAIATLAQVGEQSPVPFTGFPHQPASLNGYLRQLDWSKPWDAGAHFACQAVFITTQAPRFLDSSTVDELRDACRHFSEQVLDSDTGSYFSGDTTPEHGHLVNGAMKVLTGLDWLDVPVHYPEPLIDTCLRSPPRPEGCHLVDAVYVLYRCARQTSWRRKEIQDYCRNVLDMISGHYHPAEGGFSYFVGRSQDSYYGARISRGLNEPDLHGTVLLVWALAMIYELLELNTQDWRVIRP